MEDINDGSAKMTSATIDGDINDPKTKEELINSSNYDEFKFNPAGKKEFSSSDYEKLKILNETRLSILNSFKYLSFSCC